MTITVEDGTGLTLADAFISCDEFRAYQLARGRATASEMEDADVEPLIVRATDYMQEEYVDRWVGLRKTYTQSLEWPRAYAKRSESWPFQGTNDQSNYWWSENIVPPAVKNACAELAFKAITSTDLRPDLDRPTTEETVGPLTVRYAIGARETIKYPSVDRMLSRLLIGDSDFQGTSVQG